MDRKSENLIDGIKNYCPDEILAYVAKHPPTRRATQIQQFFQLAYQLDPEWYRKPTVITNTCRKFLHNRRNLNSEKKGRPVKEVTVISDYTAVKHYLEKLQKAKILPGNTLLLPVPSSTDVFTEKDCNVLGYRTLKDVIEAASMEFALSEIAENIEKHRCEIIEHCKSLVLSGYTKFVQTQALIDKSDISAIRQTQDNLDPKYKLNQNGQRLSYFSKAHPNGFCNTVAYLAEECNGLYTRRSFPGAHHVNSWTAQEVKAHLGITDEFAVASMCIIIDELGINVCDLANAKVNKTKDGEFITVREDGSVTITTLKPRANKLIERRVLKAFESCASCVDANAVLLMLLEMRERQAKALGSNFLFVIDSSTKTRHKDKDLYRILDTRRKAAFHKIMSALPEWVTEAQPTMPKIRVSRAVLKWIESGGDTLETSLYLGNSLATALKNYIPHEIQEFVYRKKIRDYQNIKLMIGEEISPGFAPFVKMNSETPKRQLHDAINSIRALTRSSSISDQKIYFLCSPETIELIVSYATYGQDRKLKSTCKTIILKIQDEGSRKMIKMLADAVPKPLQFDLAEVPIND